jgi:DNA-binding transcriptional LysR family regulator
MITLAKNQRFICASPKYIERKGIPQTPNELIRHECIALRENNEDVTLWQFTDEKGQPDIIRITPTLASNEGRVIKDWAIAGLGIIMRSEWDVQPQINSGDLIRLLPTYSLPNADIVALLSSPSKERSARISGFISLLKDRITPMPWK